jgi:hypothetical protein
LSRDRAIWRVVLFNLNSNGLKFTHKRAESESEVSHLPATSETIVLIADKEAMHDKLNLF